MTERITSQRRTDEQVRQLVQFAEDAARNAARTVLESAPLSKDAAQRLIGGEWSSVLTANLLATIRERVEAASSMIVRRVKVNRSRTPQEALQATGRQQCTDAEVVATMPRGEGEETEVVFFRPSPDAYDEDGWISDDGVETEFDLRGLKPVDPFSLAKVNEDDPAFADTHPNATHWKDDNGRWCYAAFDRWLGEREVRVDRNDDWRDDWWCSGHSRVS